MLAADDHLASPVHSWRQGYRSIFDRFAREELQDRAVSLQDIDIAIDADIGRLAQVSVILEPIFLGAETILVFV